MASGCLICGGTFQTVDGKPCPVCCKDGSMVPPVVKGIPAQYQGVKFDKSFLPSEMQGKYGEFMEELLLTIISDISFYQKNLIICARPNSGKTIWAYNLIAELTAKGLNVPVLRDIAEVRDILNSYENKDLNRQYSEARCVLIKLPRDMQPWMFDTMSYVVERRVRNDGFTIFLFGGVEDDLKQLDRYGRMHNLKGTGAYNTVSVVSFGKGYRE